MVERSEPGAPLRAWVAACASGEEPYTLAILIAEEAERVGKRLEVKIFATDTADKSLTLARAGVYPGGIEGDLTAERLDRFFEQDEHVYRIKKELREQVVFAPQDLLRDPPFSRVDIVTCRNLLIYIEPEAQRRVLSLLHFALSEGGYLFLGNAETLGYADTLFEVVSKRWRIYRRRAEASRFAELPALPARALASRSAGRASLTAIGRPSSTMLIQAALLEKFGPPTAVVDANERIVYFHGDAEPYLQHPSGESTHDLLDLVRAPYRAAVRGILRQAVTEKHAVTAEVPSPDSGGTVEITAGPLRQSRPPEHFYVSFISDAPGTAPDASTAPREPSKVRPTAAPAEGDSALEEELRILRRELQASVEAFEASNEELKASNEEVTSINEELQSTNEELETSKEELQSLNEELVTINSQLQTKVLELEALTNDLDNLLSSTDIAVVFLDTQLRVRRFTTAILDLIQLVPADVGRPLADFAQKFRDGDVLADAARVLSKLAPLESEVLSHSGRWYLRRALPYRTEDNRIEGVVLTFIDITARKRAEQEIIATQERLQAVIEQMPAAILLVEQPLGHLQLANRRAAELFGQPYPFPEIGREWSAAIPAMRGYHGDGHGYEVSEWPLARTLADGEIVLSEEIDFLRFDGTRIALSMGASPVRNRAGEVTGAVAAFWDITDRKRAETALRESEERFRLLVESARDFAIFMLDLQGNVMSWNAGAERVTGYREAEILGQAGAILFTPEDRTAGIPERELRLARDAGRAEDERWHLRQDGTRFWASGVMTAARDAQGILRGFVTIMRDQSDRRTLDARLQEALQSAQQQSLLAEGANRAKDEFISTVSHELRTPLNTIRLWSRMLVNGTVKGEDVVKGGRIIDRAALAQQQLVDDLLDVSRIATGQLRLDMRDASLSRAIEGALETIRPLADSRQITLAAQLSPEVGIVCIDPDRLQQVVWNLLANAVNFTPQGGRVDVRARRIEGTVEIEVRDTGVGIAAGFLPHVFDRFRQADASISRRHTGLGLGLAIAKQLIELHGGMISAQSEGEGHGATFTVHLPLERRPALASEETSAANISGTEGLRGLDVLLVEDDPMAREATGRILEQSGAQVHTASSAAQARELFQSGPPDVIVADIGMAEEDGYALIRTLRAIEQQKSLPRTPAIAVTAFARTEDRERALAAGFDEHVPKPLDVSRLVSLLAQCLRRTRIDSADFLGGPGGILTGAP